MDGRRSETRIAELTEMRNLHHEIVRLSLLGEKNVTIAERLNITPQTVSNTLNSSIVQRHLARLQGERDEQAVDVSERLVTLSQEATNILEGILSGEVDGVAAPLSLRFKAATEVLDRAGHGKTTNVNVRSASMHVRAEDIEAIKERAAARRSSRVIDADSDTHQTATSLSSPTASSVTSSVPATQHLSPALSLQP